MSDDAGLEIGLEEELRRAARLLDPVPERLIREAKYAFAFHTIDAELAELTFDSLDPEHAAAVRGAGGPRLLTFESATLTVEIEITEYGDARRLTGQLSPPRPADIDLRCRHRERTIHADDLGRFACDDLPAGLLGVRCRTAEETVVTDWVAI
ncbi:hypothetical protein AB0K60_03045 [Thermopolyspora sp. NPDC052614]|uniref:hypothetical protein n=1 Tax=Thermopolyspora sp. NPDC052614 TaxID=3155682 RepID=UPI00341E67C9